MRIVCHSVPNVVAFFLLSKVERNWNPGYVSDGLRHCKYRPALLVMKLFVGEDIVTQGKC